METESYVYKSKLEKGMYLTLSPKQMEIFSSGNSMKPVAQANAQLIAVAPEMLVVCKHVLADHQPDSVRICACVQCEMLRAVIVKAHKSSIAGESSTDKAVLSSDAP